MDWHDWGYIAACLIVPAAWGALTAWLFSRFDRRRERQKRESANTIDYMI